MDRDWTLDLARDVLEATGGVLVRVWLVGPGDQCPSCPLRPECPDRARCLHLVCSVGASRRTDGAYRRFPIGARRVGGVAVTLRPVLERDALAGAGLADPAWLAAHRVRSFAVVPLAPAGRNAGVLALFSRRRIAEADVRLLALAARAAAAAADDAAAGAAETRTLAEIEREAIERALARCAGRVSGPRGAAAGLGLKPSTLNSRMKKLGVRRTGR